jgi:curved DNA-binding protein
MESTMANDYYKTLGISRSASQEEIAKAYRKLARKYHPDLNPEDQSAKKRFQEIQTAYDTLNDPEKRKMYDQFGDGYEQYRQGNPFGGGGRTGGAGGFDFGDIFGGAGGSGAVDLGDIFRQFGAGAGGSTRSRRTATPRGPDISGEIEVPLRTIIEGGERQFRLDRDGQLESIAVKIPAGMEPGKKIRLRGQGGSIPNGKAGDLLLTVNVESHPAVKLVGNNLEMRLPVSLNEAVAGAKVDVQTPKGTITITIPPMTSSGKRLRLKGQGLVNSKGPGDMIIEVLIKLPESISPEAKETIQGLDAAYPKNLRDSIQW